ncbi:MAG: hypothetical protein WC001_13130 [Desulfurivibrionaceae bacterium]
MMGKAKFFAAMAGFLAVLAAGVVLAAAPVALVEEVSGIKTLEVLDYVSAGQVVDLGKGGSLTLGYLSSCVHEEIAGGRVTIGEKESKVKNGKVTRSKVVCDGGRLMLAANQAVQSAATAVRDVDLKGEPKVVVYDTSPLITLPKTGRVVIKRVDMPGERHTIEMAGNANMKTRLDLANENILLAPGGIYMVSVGGMAQIFQVATEAKRGGVPLVGRLVPF